MKNFDLEAIRSWYGKTELSHYDPLAVISLVVSLFVVILVIRILFRLSSTRSVGSVERMGAGVQEIKLRFDDFVGRFSTKQTQLEEEIKQLRFELSRLMRDQGVTESRREEPRESEKKKSDETLPDKTFTVGETKKALEESLSLTAIPKQSTDLDANELLSSPLLPLQAGLSATRRGFLGQLKALFSRENKLEERFFDELEEILITSDLGVKTTQKLLSQLRQETLHGLPSALGEEQVISNLKRTIVEILKTTPPGEISKENHRTPYVILVVGVNGVGKTTTVGKLAAKFRTQGKKVLVAACDTFRAAASEQLEAWAAQAGAEIEFGGENEKPSTVCYRAIHRAQDENFDVLLIDTAGRLHTRVNLMNELKSVLHIIGREQPGSPEETILVVDASTGQNALQQAKEFHQAVALSGVIITKLDGTQKGGVVIAIKEELGIPIKYIGIGEGVEDLRSFSAEEFSEALFSEGNEEFQGSSKISQHGKIRRLRREELKSALL